MMRVDALARRAHAGAATDLVAETGAAALGIESQRLQAQTMVVGERAQRDERRPPRAVNAIDEWQRIGVDFASRGEAQSLPVENETAGRLRTPQRTVVGRSKVLHQARFRQQRTELAHRAPP